MIFGSPQKVAQIRKLLLIGFAICYILNFYTYLSRIDSYFSTDLRNRVVGARLLELGKNPYYFKWDSTQPGTLADPIDLCGIKNNRVTSPPSLLWLMRPVVNENFKDISFSWVIVHYVFFLVIFISAYTKFSSDLARAGLSIMGGILLFTSQWAESVFVGQNHFILPAIIAICMAIASTNHKHRFLTLGLLFAFAIWIRPNAVLIFPFLYTSYKVNRKELLAAFATGCLILFLLTIFLNQQQYWVEFYHSCNDWINYFVSKNRSVVTCDFPEIIEGRKLVLPLPRPANWSAQYANVFPLVYRTMGADLPLSWITFSCTSIYCICLFYWWRFRNAAAFDGLMVGMFLYWIFEICSPIPKITYYFTELFIVALFLAAMFKAIPMASRLLLLLSTIILFLSIIPANLVIAEMLLMTSLAVYLIAKYVTNRNNKKSHPGTNLE